jgi:alpha-galactosidase
VIDIDQDPLGKPGYRVSKNGDLEVWMRHLEDGSLAVGLFNRGESETEVTAIWKDLGISGEQKVRDLWRQKDIGTCNDKFTIRVGRHGVVLVRILPVGT